MGFESDFDEKMDIIDLIINVLKDHENKLDELVSRMENRESIEVSNYKPEENFLNINKINVGKTETSILLNDWVEFRKLARSSEFVVFDTQNGLFTVSSSTTSSPAPKTLPDLSASTNALVSIIAPRDVFTIITPFFIFSNSFFDNSCLVSSVRGV